MTTNLPKSLATDHGSDAPLILASASPRRLDLLGQLGITPTLVDPADIDESVRNREKPKNYALRVAAEKASTVAARHHSSLILSADTVVACGQRILPKAEDIETARRCLSLLSGRRHRVITGMSLILPTGDQLTKAVTTQVAFKSLSHEEMNFYLESDEWFGKAGGYAIQGIGAGFVRFISGSYSNVVGLPLFEIAGWLKAHWHYGRVAT